MIALADFSINEEAGMVEAVDATSDVGAMLCPRPSKYPASMAQTRCGEEFPACQRPLAILHR